MVNERSKNKSELLSELKMIRQRVTELEALENEHVKAQKALMDSDGESSEGQAKVISHRM